MKDLPKPDAVLLILDSTNLARHLVLAAPVLSLGLPTLVILNMADDLASRGGGVDVAELACSSDRRWLWSAHREARDSIKFSSFSPERRIPRRAPRR